MPRGDRDGPRAVALIGTGRAARVLAPALHAAGYDLAAIVGRRRSAVSSVARGLRVGLRTTDAARGARSAPVVLLAVGDTALPELSARLAGGATDDWSGRTVLHLAGALGPGVLAPLARRGASVGVLHPLQSLAVPALAREILAGSRARIEGDPRARRIARRIAIDIGLRPLVARRPLSDGDRAAYHTAASLVSNDVLALIWDALEIMTAAGFTRAAALDGLTSLARGTLRQIDARGPAAALTGPVVRGDLETVERQLVRAARRSPELADAHRALSLRLAALARRSVDAPVGRLQRRLRARSIVWPASRTRGIVTP